MTRTAQTPDISADGPPRAARAARRWPLVLAIAVCLFMWGTSYTAIKIALHDVPPVPAALLRFVVASVAMAAYALALRRPPPQRRDLPLLTLLGLVGLTSYNILLNVGQAHVTAGTASLLIATVPLIVAVLARPMLGEKLGLRGWIGFLISFGGTLLIVLGQGKRIEPSVWAVLILCAAVCGALFSILQKPLLKRYSAIDLTSYAIWTGTALLALGSPAMPWRDVRLTGASVGALVFLGLGPGAAGYISFAYIVSRMPASRAVTILYVVPVVAVAAGFVVLGEVPTLPTLAGGAVSIAGVILVTTRGKPALNA